MEHNTKTIYKPYLGSASLCKDMSDLGADEIFCVRIDDLEKIMRFSNPTYVYEEPWSKERTRVYVMTVLTNQIAITDRCGLKVGRDVYQKFLNKSEEILGEYLSGKRDYLSTLEEFRYNRTGFSVKMAEV